MSETKPKLKVKLHPYRPNFSTGNIIWADRNLGDSYYRVSQFAMRGGRFPATHPVAPGDGKSNDRAEMGTGAALDAFRARGYWASCFPEGDGITWKPEREQTDAQCLTDIRECFGWPDVSWGPR